MCCGLKSWEGTRTGDWGLGTGFAPFRISLREVLLDGCAERVVFGALRREDDRLGDLAAAETIGGLVNARIFPFREDDAGAELGGAGEESLPEAHFLNFSLSPLATAGCTREATLPPWRATSRTMLELM